MRLTVFLSALLFPLLADAQFIELGAHAGGGGAMLLNNNVSDQDGKLDYKASFGPVYGISAGISGRTGWGFAVELNRTSVNQRYEGDLYEYTITPAGITNKAAGRFLTVENVRYWEVPVLFRKYSRRGFFFEFGPKFSFLEEAETRTNVTEYEPGGYPFIPFTEEEDRYVTAGFRDVVVSGVLGLGGTWEVAPGLHFNTRLRLAYGLSDATEEYTKDQLTRVDPNRIGTATTFAHMRQDGTYGYEQTSIASAHIMLGFAYRLRGGDSRRGGEKEGSGDDE